MQLMFITALFVTCSQPSVSAHNVETSFLAALLDVCIPCQIVKAFVVQTKQKLWAVTVKVKWA